jgi:hypothetical protein
MRQLSFCGIDARERLGPTAASIDRDKAAAVEWGEHDTVVNAPAAARRVNGRITDVLNGSTIDGNLAQLAVGKKGHPFAIRGNEWMVCPLSSLEENGITDIERAHGDL